MVHGEKKSAWTKKVSEKVWSIERKRACGPKRLKRPFGPLRKKERVDQKD